MSTESDKKVCEVSKKEGFRVSHNSIYYKKPFDLTINTMLESQVYYTADGSFPWLNHIENANLKHLSSSYKSSPSRLARLIEYG
jgi:hypothetical protein